MNLKTLGIITTFLLFLATNCLPSSAEENEVWTFQNCLDYAMEQNLDIQKGNISIEESRINTKLAKAQWQPSLGFSSSHSLNNSPWAAEDKENTSYNGNYNLGASWTVFNGFRRKYNIKQQELQEEIEETNISETEEYLKVAVLTNYIQVLYAIENLKNKRNSFEVATSEHDRNRQLQEAGSISKSDFAQIDAQYNREKYELVVAENDLIEAKLNLKLLLRLNPDVEMEILSADITEDKILSEIPDKITAYNNAMNFRPDVRNAMLNQEMSELKVKSSKSGYYPSVNLSAGVGTGHNSQAEIGVGRQMKQNFGENVGISLNYSILDNRSRKSEKEKAELGRHTASLQTEQIKDDLKKLIESAHNNATAAQLNYIASRSNEAAEAESYELTREKFNLGSKNPYEMLESKNSFLNAQRQTLQAKYTALLNINILNIYQGLNIEL